MENPSKMDDLGVPPYFWKHPYIHIYVIWSYVYIIHVYTHFTYVIMYIHILCTYANAYIRTHTHTPFQRLPDISLISGFYSQYWVQSYQMRLYEQNLGSWWSPRWIGYDIIWLWISLMSCIDTALVGKSELWRLLQPEPNTFTARLSASHEHGGARGRVRWWHVVTRCGKSGNIWDLK